MVTEKGNGERGSPQHREIELSDGRKAKVRSSPPTLAELANLGGVIVDIFENGRLDFGRVIRNMPTLAAEAVWAPTPPEPPEPGQEPAPTVHWVGPDEVAELGAADGTKIVEAAVEWLEMVPLESIVIILGKVGALAKNWAAQRRTSARASDAQPQGSPPPSASDQEK